VVVIVTSPASFERAWEESAIGATVSGAWHAVRHIPDRLAHSSRRARAIASLRAGPPPRTVLYICLANLCRSPYAAAASRRDAALWHVPAPAWLSAGLIGPVRACPSLAIEVSAARGASLASHRSEVVQRSHVENSDLIVVMEAYQAEELAVRFGRRRRVVLLGDFDPQPIRTRAIPDPWDQGREAIVASFERIDRCLAAIAWYAGAPAAEHPASQT
jgi:protein-tyrosine-phosphatase